MGIGPGPFTSACSHPQALGQSRRYLRQRGIVPMSYADTAGAAAYVAELGDPAAGRHRSEHRRRALRLDAHRRKHRGRASTT